MKGGSFDEKPVQSNRAHVFIIYNLKPCTTSAWFLCVFCITTASVNCTENVKLSSNFELSEASYKISFS